MSEQTRLFSLLEVGTGRLLGYSAATCLQMFVLPLYGLDITFSQSAQIALVFTSSSMILAFLVRRLFNYLQKIGIGVKE